MSVQPATPDISVIVVSDYRGGGEKSWSDIRTTLKALACQDYVGHAEFILAEAADAETAIPADFTEVLPSLRVMLSDEPGSYGLKNAAAQASLGSRIAFLDADCTPHPDWLRHLMEAMDAHPEAAAVSGRSLYENKTSMERIFSLLTRSFADPGKPGPTRYVSNNNAGWQRDVCLAFPLPTDTGPFVAHLQSEAILRAGGKFWFEPAAAAVHDFEGWAMEADIRRNIGYGTVITRLRDPQMPYAGLIRLGVVAIPGIVTGKLWNTISDCFRCWRPYGVRWYELPLALALAVPVHLMEVAGMWAAYRDGTIADTAYR